MKQTDSSQIRVPTHSIAITEEIINKACRRDSRHCMIAEAIREQIQGATFIAVDMMTIRFSVPEKGLRFSYHTPPLAQDALARFDRGIEVDPFTIKLKNGHAISMVQHVKENDGVSRRKKKIHDLGPKKMKIKHGGKHGIETEIIGGEAIPVQKPKHGSHSSIRVFGMRNWTEGWKHISEI